MLKVSHLHISTLFLSSLSLSLSFTLLPHFLYPLPHLSLPLSPSLSLLPSPSFPLSPSLSLPLSPSLSLPPSLYLPLPPSLSLPLPPSPSLSFRLPPSPSVSLPLPDIFLSLLYSQSCCALKMLNLRVSWCRLWLGPSSVS